MALVAVTCPNCKHRGFVVERKLTRILACSHGHHSFHRRSDGARLRRPMVDDTPEDSLREMLTRAQ